MTRLYYSWSELAPDIKSIISQINYSSWFPDFIVGIKRGGLVPATILSHYLNLPMLVVSCQIRDGKSSVDLVEVDQRLKNRKVLLVDDICDEGKTLFKIINEFKEIGITDCKTCTLFFNIRQNFNVDFKAKKIDRFEDNSWIVFPWEI